MVKPSHAPGIPDYIRRIVVLSTIIITIGVGGMVILQQFRLFVRISQQKKESIINKHKDFIKDLITIEMGYIVKQKEQFDQRKSNELSVSVDEAIHLAGTLYDAYKETLSENALKQLIVKAISSLSYSSPYTHVFINDLNGNGIYYSGNPDFVGRNLLDLSDRNGNQVVKTEIDLINKNGGGFLCYDGGSMNGHHSGLRNKISYVKKFAPLGWYFGAKCYLDDYYDEFKTEIARKVSSERFRYGGYVFMNELNGDPVVMNGAVYAGNFNFYDGSDTAKLSVFKKQVRAVQQPGGGGYFTYWWNKIGEKEKSKKISYVRYFEPCNWIVGAGFYLDDAESELVLQNSELKRGMYSNLLQLFVVLAIALVSELFLIYRFNRNFQTDFFHFTRFFRLGKGSYQKIDEEKLHFREFRDMGRVANEMIDERARVHQQLLDEQNRAQESDRLKTAFLANMSHEIRTPMNAILGFSELLDDENIDAGDRQNFVRIILQNGEMLMNLINDIIDISKIESGQLPVVKAHFNLARLLESIQRHYTGVLEKSPDCKVDFELLNLIPDDFTCYSDEFRLKQVLFNLLGNAVKFTSEGYVRLEVYLQEGLIFFNVADTGIGISEEDKYAVFERFMQVNNHLSRNYGGTGLGLAISKNIVGLLGGEIGVDSVVGKGSEFKFYIPA